MRPVLAVHGIGNLRPNSDPEDAATALAERWQPRPAAGYRAAGPDAPPPRIAAVYNAHPLTDQESKPPPLQELDNLTPEESGVGGAQTRS